MTEEISKVLKLVEEGKLDKEQAAELINLLQDKGNSNSVNLQKQPSNPYLDKVLKVRVSSEAGDDVNVNLPIKLVKAVLGVGVSIAERIPQAEKYVKDINIDLLIDAIENELEGQIVDVTSANGEKVLVFIE